MKLKLFLIASLVIYTSLPFTVLAQEKTCKGPNSFCPQEDELFSKVMARYRFSFTTMVSKNQEVFGNRNRLRRLNIFFTKDPNVKSGLKYNVGSINGAPLFGDGMGSVDHGVINFKLPIFQEGFGKVIVAGSFNCSADISSGNSSLDGVCTSIFKSKSTFAQLIPVIGTFKALPLTRISILGETVKPNMTCVSNDCPDISMFKEFLKSNYSFSANLVDGQTENYRIEITPNPEIKEVFNYDVINQNTGEKVYGSGVGLFLYRKLYFDLPVFFEGTNDFITFNCTGTLNTSDSLINGNCTTIQDTGKGELNTVGGSFTASPN